MYVNYISIKLEKMVNRKQVRFLESWSQYSIIFTIYNSKIKSLCSPLKKWTDLDREQCICECPIFQTNLVY